MDAPHLSRYVDEQVFRFNECCTNDAGRFTLAMPGIIGKRLMYKTLIGATTDGDLKKAEPAEATWRIKDGSPADIAAVYFSSVATDELFRPILSSGGIYRQDSSSGLSTVHRIEVITTW